MSDSPEFYRLVVARRAKVGEDADLVEPVERIVRALQKEDPELFRLLGYSPAYSKFEVIDGEKSLVPNFLMTSQIQWNFGREPRDPTNQVIFFNDYEDERYAGLKVVFSVEKPEDGIEAAGPGLVAELFLGTVPAGPGGAARTARLDRLFALLVEAFAPDHGRVELPGHPEAEGESDAPGVGWLTYRAGAEPPRVPPPATATPLAGGVTIRLAPGDAPDRFDAVADATAAVRAALG